MLLIVSGAALFVVLGCWMVGAFGDPPTSRRYGTSFIAMIGWVSILFFGACTVVGLRRLMDKNPQLRISAAGIYWKPWSQATIPWSEIADVSTWKFKRQKSIILKLRNPGRFPSETLLGKVAGANRALTGGDIAISMTGLDRSFDQAMAAIHAFWRRTER